MKLLTRFIRPFAALVVSVAALQCVAMPMYTNDRNDIFKGNVIDWGLLGGDLTPVTPGFVLPPITVSGASAYSVFSGSTFNADFAPTDSILALFDLNTGNPVFGTFTIDFALPMFSAGAQIQANSFGSFSGTISAYDISNMLIASYAVSGFNGGNGDGSAIFAGITTQNGDISRLVFSGFGEGAGINQLSYSQIPEPATLFMLAMGIALIAVTRRSQRINGR